MHSPLFNSQFSILNSQLGSVATIGSFDGVHRGHQCLLGQVRHIADEYGLNAVAITFGTSPKKVLGGGDVSQLTSSEERTTLLHRFGMDKVAVLDFTPQMAEMTAYDFMLKVLKEQLHVAVLVIGYDHRFGRGRSEGFDDYVRYGREIGIEVVRGEACFEDGEPVSSTRIRHLLEEGRVDEAAHLLGYRYTLHGKVVGGYQEGRKMGFPTANIRIDNGQQTTDEVCASERNASVLESSQRAQPKLNNEVVNGQQTTDKVVDCKLIPTDGVYAVWVRIGQQTTDKVCVHELQNENNSQFSILNSQLKKGMLNIGYRPTLNNGRERSIEVHILDYDGDLYGKDIMVEFAYRLREERAFANTDELTKQLEKDKEQVKELLAQ